MKSWWNMTKEEQDARMAIEPLSLGGVSETFRHPASYAELRLVQTVWKYVEEVRALRKALEWFADEGHYEGTYRHGAGFVDAVGLTQARAALLGMSPDDADAVGVAWRERASLRASEVKS